MKIKTIVATGVAGICLSMPMAFAKVSPEEAAKLGTELTPMGAQKEGNADGTIPAWTGSMRGLPAGLKYSGSGDVYPDPYGDEKPLFVITAENMSQYEDKLSEGQKAMFKKYPTTFKMPVYPSHRDGRYSETIEARVKWNATRTELVNGIDGLQNFTGNVPFPIPADGAEVIHNARNNIPNGTMAGSMDDIAVYPNGTTSNRRQLYMAQFPFSYPDNKVGATEADLGINAAYVHVTIEEPKRSRGQMTIVHEAVDQVRNDRKAWVYLPGSRRVRRAPTVGYDTPDGPGGLVTVDDSLGFNGAMDRYDWTLVGKKEIYIPFHNYKFDDPGVKYNELLTANHANPEYMRYELHRVWVVEANLKQGARHIYAKRRFYMNEDMWQINLLESYDGRGDLWRVGIMNTLYDFATQGYLARAQMYHDLQSGAYVAMRLVNETSPTDYTVKAEDEKFYSPGNLRKMGR